MSLREALLSIHGSLGADQGARDRKRQLFSDLTDRRYLETQRRVVKGEQDRNSLDPEVDELSETVTSDDPDAAVAFGTTEHPVLRVELLEAVAAAAIKHSFDNDDAFASDPALLRLAAQLVADRADAAKLLRLIFDQRESQALVNSQPRLLQAHRDGSQFHQAPSSTDRQSTLSFVESKLDGSFALAPALTSSVGAEPGAHCLARLVPVSIDGQGEYALSFRTTVDPVEFPSNLSVADFVAELFEPANWPARHPFWCSMDQEPEGDHAPAAPDLMAAMAGAQATGEAAGAVYGQRRVYREAVGTCSANNGQGTWPNTILVFADSHFVNAADATTRHYLEYRLVPGASPSLALDDGTIQVIEDGQTATMTVTKMLFFNETAHSSQAELMAVYACISGWADQTRLFLMNWLNSQ